MGHLLFIVLALVAGSFAGPISEITVSDTCAKQCTVSNKFNYEEGRTYEFTYDTDIRTAIQGASEDHAGIHLSSKVYLDFISKCEMVLRLSDVKLSEHDPETATMKPVKSDLIRDLENNPVTVSYQDGAIEELCLANAETDKTLNIKRGVLSLIQNNMDDITSEQTVKESDVAGECDTQYTSEDKGWYNKLIKKTKNLLGCTGRQSAISAVQGMPYDSNSNVQGLPLIKSTQECEQEIAKDTGRIQVASCHEKHVFVPFSRQDSGATTHNTQTLTFTNEYKSRAKSSSANLRASLQFQHSDGDSQEASIKNIERKLMEICESTANGVTSETPKMFTSLVYAMKPLDSSAIDAIFQKIKSQTICSKNNKRVGKFFLDAIPMAGTTEAIKYMTKLITSGEVSGIQADIWMTTLAFIQNPTVQMLNEVKNLLTVDSIQQKAMLSVSSLVNSLCRNNPSCENYIEVKKIISLLEGSIAPSCKVTDDNLKSSLLALRAIGNAGYGTSAIPTLVKCIQWTDNPIEIRLSAVEAFRRIPCSADKTSLVDLFSNMEEDSEVRIAAYKSLMECASDDLIRKVKVVLSKEQINQVGSYVWTHLTNLMETSDPHKQSIRSILEDETLQAEFNMDNRKYSRNYEKSLFIEKINTGATAEGDLIWSSKSFIPRAGMLNLTVDLFGNAINLFEIGGRMEGLEYFLESYFGPNGYFSENDVQAAVDETAVDTIKADKVKRIDRRMGAIMDELRGSLYVRVFGNEIRYMNFHGIESLVSQNGVNFLDILMKLAKDNDYQFTHSSMFVDSSIIIPTSSGFPMNLTVNGTVTVDLKATGKMDMLKLASSPPTLDINGIIRPSAAIVVSSSMGIDALSTQVGVKMVSTLTSSTAVQGKVSLTEGSVLSAEFDLPEEKMDIISIKSEFFTVHRESERLQKMITDNRKTYSICSGNKLAKISGLEICGEMSFPNASLVENAPYFPITGPVNAAVSIYKRDQLTGYKLEARSTHNADENIVRFAFSTPNSNIDRSFDATLNLNKAEGTLYANLRSPWKQGNFKGSFVNERMEKGISGRLNWGKYLLDVAANLKSEKSGPGMMYTPSVTVRIPQRKPIALSGKLTYAPWRQIDTDMTLAGLTASPITVKSTIANKLKVFIAKASVKLGPKAEYSFDSSMQKTAYKKKVIYKPRLSIRSPSKELIAFGGTLTNVYGKIIELDVVLDKIVSTPVMMKTKYITKAFRRGRIQRIVNVDFRSKIADLKMKSKLDNRNMKTIATDISLTYVIRGIARDGIKFVSKVTNLSNKRSTIGKLAMNMASKQNPDYNFKVMSNINHNWKASGVDVDINYGSDFKNKEKQIGVTATLSRAIKNWYVASATLNGKLEIGTSTRIISRIDHAHTPKSLGSTIMFRLNKNAIETSLTLQDQSSKSLANLNGQFEINMPGGKSIVLSQTINETSPGDFMSATNARFGKSRNSLIASWSIPTANSLKLSSNISISAMEPVSIQGEYNFEENDYKIAGSLSKSSSKYSAQLSSQLASGSIKGSADIELPSRHIVGNYEGTKVNNRYTSRADIRWNADRDDAQRVTISGNGQIQGLSDIDGSLTVQYPSRTIALNIKQSIASKYATHIDFKWDPTKIISLDTTFGNYMRQDNREIIGTLKLSTPFTYFNSLDMSIDHQITEAAYTTKVDLGWSPRDKVSGTMTLKTPLSLSNIDAEFTGKAPSQGLKSIQASLNHKVTDGVSSVAKLSWNKQMIQVGLSLANSSGTSKTDVMGQIDIKTSFRKLKTASLTIEHLNTGRKLDTNAVLQYNKKSYGLKSSLRNRLSGWNLNSNGDVTLTLPSNTFSANWQHRNTLNELVSSSDLNLDGKTISLKINGLQNMALPEGTLSATIELASPFNSLKNIVLQVNHQHSSDLIDSSFSLLNEGNSLAASELKYLRENNKVTSTFTMSNPIYDGEVMAAFNADFSSYPSNSHLEVSLTPLQKLTFDGTVDIKKNSNMDFAAELSLPNMSMIKFRGSRNAQTSGVNSDVALEYQPGQTIRIETFHRLNDNTEMSLKFTSPFTNDYSATGTYNSRNGVKATGSIEAEPYISKWSMSGSLDKSNGITSNIRVNTPYPEIPYAQISVLSNIVDSERQSSGIVEYMPGKTIEIQSSYHINSLKDLAASIKVNTPFEVLPYASATIRHNGDLSQFSNYAELEYSRDEKLSLDSRFSTVGGMSGSVSVKTPFTTDMTASINHEGNLNNFQTRVDASCNGTVQFDIKHQGTLTAFTSSGKATIGQQNYGGSISFSLNPTIDSTIVLEIPSKVLRMSHSFDGTWSKFGDHFEASMTGYGMYVSDLNVDIQSMVDISAALQTPIKGFRDIKMALKHEGDASRFQTHVDLQNGLKMYSGDVKLNTEPTFTFEAILKTPQTAFKQMRVSLSQEGTLDNFKLHGEFQKNKATSQFDLNANVAKKWDIDFTLRSPYMDTVKASLDHWGKLSKFNSKLLASFGSQKVQSNVKFALKPSLSALVSLKSPISWLKNQQLSIKHTGNLNSFKCNMQYKNNGKTYVGDATFQNTNSLKAEMNLKGPSFRPVKAAISHEGRPENFKTTATMSMGKKAIEMNANVNSVNGVKGNVGITTPFDGFENIKGAVTHTGQFNNFKSHCELALNKKAGQVDVSLDSTRDITASIAVATPFQGYKDISATFKHTGDMQSFNTIGQVSKDGDYIEGQASFNNGDIITGSSSLKSSYPELNDYATSFTHQGDLTKFNTNGEIKYGQQPWAANVDFDSTDGYQGSATLDCPLMKKTELQFKHSSADNSLNSNAFVSYDGLKQYGITTDISSEPSLSGLVTIITPHDGYKSTELTVHHDGNMDSFRSNAAFEIFGTKYETEVGFSAFPDMQITMTIKSPQFDDIETAFNLQGKLTQLEGKYEMLYGQKSQVLIETKVNLEGPYSGDFKMLSPHVRNAKASFRHSGDLNSFTTEGQITYAGRKSSTILTVKMNPSIEAAFEMSSPLTKDVKITFSHSGPVSSCKTTGELKYDQEMLFTLDSSLDVDSDINGQLKISTPIPGYSILLVKFNKEGNMNDLKSHAEMSLDDKIISGDLTFSPNSGTISLSAPFMNNIIGSFDTDNARFNSMLSYGDLKLYDITFSMNLPNAAVITIEVPIQGFETSRLTFKSSGDIGGHFELQINEITHAVDAYANIDQNLAGFFALNSPVLTPVSARFEHRGRLLNFQTNAEIMYNDNKFQGDVEFKLRPTISGSISIKTPYTDEFQSSINAEGQLRNFKTSGKVSYGDEMHEARASFNMLNKVNGQIDIMSPRIVPVSVSFEQIGVLSDFSANADITVDNDKYVGDVSARWTDDIVTSFSLSAPDMTPVSGHFSLSGQLDDFTADGDMTIYNKKTTAEVSLSMNSNIKGSLKVDSPVKDITASFAHTGTLRNFVSDTQVTIDGERSRANAAFNIEKAISGNVEVSIAQLPPVSGSFSITGELTDFTANGDVTVDSDKYVGDVSARWTDDIVTSFSLSAPDMTPVSGHFSLSGQLNDFTADGDMTIYNKKTTAEVSLSMNSNIKGSLKVDSPVKDITASFAHTGTLRNFVSDAQVTIDGERSLANAAFNIETAISGNVEVNIAQLPPVKVTFDHTGTLSNFLTTLKVEKDQDDIISSEVTFSKTPLEGKITLKTPVVGYETITAMFSHNGEVLNFNNHAEIVISGEKTQADMSFDIGSKLQGKLSATSPYFPAIGFEFDFSGNAIKAQSSVEFMYGTSTYSIDADVDMTTKIDVSMIAKTPYNGYKTVTGKLTHSGPFPNINSFAQVKTGRRNLMTANVDISTSSGISAKISAQSILTPTVQMTLEHTGELMQFNTNGEVRIDGQSHTIAIVFHTTPTPSGSISIASPLIKPISGSFTLRPETSGNNVHIEGTIDGQTVSGELIYATGNQMGFSTSLKTPFTGFEQMKASASLKNMYKAVSAQAELEYPGTKLNLQSNIKWRQDISASISINTPKSLIGRATADFTLHGRFPNIETDLKADILGQIYSISGEMKADTQTVAKINIVTPFLGFENVGVSFIREGEYGDMTMNGKVDYMTGRSMSFSFENTKTDGRLETKAKLETPYTDEIAFDMVLSGEPMDISHSMSISIGDESVTLSSTFKMDQSSLALESSLRTVLKEFSNEQKISINYGGELTNFRASATAKIMGSYYSTEASINTVDKINVMFKLNTPVSNKNIEFNFEHVGNYRRFSTKTELKYFDNKKITANVEYSRYGWRRIQSSFELNTPFSGFETTKASYRHSGTNNGFECDVDASFMNKDITGTIRASSIPMSMSISISTPFTGFEQIGSDMKLGYETGILNAETTINFMQGKTIAVSADINMNDSPKTVTLKMSTPFTGYENAEIRLSQAGVITSLQSTATFTSTFAPSFRADGNLRYNTWSSLDGSLSFSSQIENFEKLKFSINNEALRGKYTSKVEMSWAPSRSIVIDGTFTDNSYSTSADITIRTPFSALREVNMYTKCDVRGQTYTEKLTVQYNGETITDGEVKVDLSEKKSVSLLMRSPVSFSINMDGEINDKYDGAITFSLPNANNADYKMTGSYNPSTMKLSVKYSCPINTVDFDGTLTTMNLNVNGAQYGYDISLEGTDKYVKAILPQRNLMATFAQRSGTTEGYFKWDADRDESKKIGFRSEIQPTQDSVKADVTLMIPSIGKDLQIGSEMILNRGRIIFDGKTELSYSRDSSKKFTITSRVEDLSTWSSKNYSFTFGISHPYTSVGIQVESHVGNSDKEVTGAVGVKYLTALRETKEFAANGAVNKLRNSVSLNIDTPLKKIGINGVAQTTSPYRLSLTNKYDNNRPLNTIVTLDPTKRTFDIQMNYDLDNPRSEFHVSARYVNSSAIATEMYHVVNRQRVTDALLALRLNNSHLLHGRVHWRPELITDLKAFYARKSGGYSRQMNSFANVVSRSILSEAIGKGVFIKESVDEELAPVTAIVAEEMEKVAVMYEKNEYHIKDITDFVVRAAEDASNKLEDAYITTEEYISMVSAEIETRLEVCRSSCQERIQTVILTLEEATGIIADRSATVYNKYADHVYNISSPYMQAANTKYNDYVQYISDMDTSRISSMADQYTSAIYGARDYINSGVSSLMARDDVQYAKSIYDNVIQHGKNADKYWEIRENAEMVAQAIVDWIKEEIENEISDIKATILNFQKTSVTVYDPTHGEIQVDVHLPIPLKSIDAVPSVDVDISRYENMIPDIPSFSMPDMNVTAWLPPYDATAFIKGNTISTFDGVTFDLSNSCTFLLAKDNVDGNFTLVLNKEGNNKTLVILADGRSIELFNNGQVRVDKKPLTMPAAIKNITFTAEAGIVSIDVADSIDVTFYPDIDTYIITINGFYFGKTNGILGSYDNEPSNDMMTSFGKPVADTSRFARTWDVGSARCR